MFGHNNLVEMVERLVVFAVPETAKPQRVVSFRYRDHPEKHNPASGLKCFRITKKDRPAVDRIVDLCPRALDVLKRQLALRARLKLAGTLDHEHVFFKADGQPIRILQYAWIRWHRTLTRTLKGRYRDPYNARHSSVSWNLMGLRRVIEGAKESDVEAIRRAMESSSPAPRRAREAA